jgi:hypothetical protein
MAAAGWAFGSVNLLEIVEGHVNIFSAMWLPWIYWAWLSAVRRQRSPLLCGVFLALMFYQGGIYLLSYIALSFALLPWFTSHPRQAWKVTFQSGLWALGLAAVKLLPVLWWLREFPDKAYASSTTTLWHAHEIFLRRHLHGAEVLPNQGSGWHEYGAYLGWMVIILALIGAATQGHRRVVRALIVAAIITFLVSSAGPWLKPVFDHAPFIPRSNISRLVIFTVFCLLLLAAFGFERLMSSRIGRIIAALFVVAVAIDLMTHSYALSKQAFVIPRVVPDVEPAHPPIAFTPLTYTTRVKGVDYTRSYAAARAGYGTLNYCSALGPEPAVKTIYEETGDPFASVSDNAGSITHVEWSPSTIRVQGVAQSNSAIILNTNYAPHWRANNAPATEIAGRLAAMVSPGPFDITLQYRPKGFALGGCITLATLLVIACTTFKKKGKNHAAPLA